MSRTGCSEKSFVQAPRPRLAGEGQADQGGADQERRDPAVDDVLGEL